MRKSSYSDSDLCVLDWVGVNKVTEWAGGKKHTLK